MRRSSRSGEGPTGPVSEDFSSGRSRPPTRPSRAGSPGPARACARGRRVAARTTRSRSEGLSDWCVSVRRTSSAPVGSGPGSHADVVAGSGARRRTSPSSGRSPRRRRPCSGGPSRAAPSGCRSSLRPSRSPTAACAGRGAGRRSARRCAAGCSSVPGAGRAVWRTWYERLKCGSSTQTGRPTPSGTKRTFWR